MTAPGSKPGTYVLLFRNPDTVCVTVGKLGELKLESGFVAYVGSAFGSGGIKARVERHARLEKKKHWHMDYLRVVLGLENIWYNHSEIRLEHLWSAALSQMPEAHAIKGFGCTDCQCLSHLYHYRHRPKLKCFRALTSHEVTNFKLPAIGDNKSRCRDSIEPGLK